MEVGLVGVFLISPEFIFMRHNKAVSPPQTHLPILNDTPTAWNGSALERCLCRAVVWWKPSAPSWAEDAELTQPAAVTIAAHVWHQQCHLSAPVCSVWGTTVPVLGRRKVSCLKIVQIPPSKYFVLLHELPLWISEQPQAEPYHQNPRYFTAPNLPSLGSSECLILLERSHST